MGRLVVTMNVTLDGVVQAPGTPDEDRRGGFEYGGWAAPYNDPTMAQKMGEGMARTGVMLFGRRTYENFYDSWAHRTDGNPFTEKMNRVHKYVASRTPSHALPWANSTLLHGDLSESVTELKRTQNVSVIGSGDLVQSLASAGLVDQYTLVIHPLVLGTGQRLFPDGSPRTELRLVGSTQTTTGVIIADYVPA